MTSRQTGHPIAAPYQLLPSNVTVNTSTSSDSVIDRRANSAPGRTAIAVHLDQAIDAIQEVGVKRPVDPIGSAGSKRQQTGMAMSGGVQSIMDADPFTEEGWQAIENDLRSALSVPIRDGPSQAGAAAQPGAPIGATGSGALRPVDPIGSAGSIQWHGNSNRVHNHRNTIRKTFKWTWMRER